jgi:hypothetical protein
MVVAARIQVVVDFNLGQWDILKGDTDSAKRRLQAAVDTCWKTFIEYPAAVAELKRMD